MCPLGADGDVILREGCRGAWCPALGLTLELGERPGGCFNTGGPLLPWQRLFPAGKGAGFGGKRRVFCQQMSGMSARSTSEVCLTAPGGGSGLTGASQVAPSHHGRSASGGFLPLGRTRLRGNAACLPSPKMDARASLPAAILSKALQAARRRGGPQPSCPPPCLRAGPPFWKRARRPPFWSCARVPWRGPTRGNGALSIRAWSKARGGRAAPVCSPAENIGAGGEKLLGDLRAASEGLQGCAEGPAAGIGQGVMELEQGSSGWR